MKKNIRVLNCCLGAPKVAISALLAFVLSACSDPSESQGDGKVTLHHKTDAPVLFISTQFNPIEEANKIRGIFKDGYPGEVQFEPANNSFIIRKLKSAQAESEQIVIGAPHGDLLNLYKAGNLASVKEMVDELPEINHSAYLQLARFDDKDLYFVPWMQATYLMVANKKALPYLPDGADINRLTYDQLLRWAINIKKATGEAKLGFPIGERGLMHRFFEGYLYPSFTGAVVNRFNSDDAHQMWDYFRRLWHETNVGSLSYVGMSEPLLSEEVWIGWDHSARLTAAFEADSDKFVAFPAPAGPKGRSFMAIVSGLALPVGQNNSESAKATIEFMSNSQTQIEVSKETGFFPIASGGQKNAMPASLRSIAMAISNQSESEDAIITLMPSGLGEEEGLFNALFTLSFSDIVLDNRDIGEVLNTNATQINQIFQRTGAQCWQPDVVNGEPCVVK
ncbi:ABC transporter substrate-binding protein [Vibrio sp. JC009]|uniref:ABC transporter substrate-binding protein n=1 Tax=Vibrio sp. JC009 TaxID=2912314 RepID=UPI0023B01B41|nr:ABC transporter substrate-binding protein [Vibrio sp. JC009]WED24767.1 ABC transporter substrate-binding protein [Vibrio sp. JC009]